MTNQTFIGRGIISAHDLDGLASVSSFAVTNPDPVRHTGPSRSAMSKYSKDSHKRAARMLGYALTLDDPKTWNHLGYVLYARLTPFELASIAFAVLDALDPDARELIYRATNRARD